jgi:hypothetical protein
MNKVHLGLKENWKQFTLLVIINAFVGGMIGLKEVSCHALQKLNFILQQKQQCFLL